MRGTAAPTLPQQLHGSRATLLGSAHALTMTVSHRQDPSSLHVSMHISALMSIHMSSHRRAASEILRAPMAERSALALHTRHDDRSAAL